MSDSKAGATSIRRPGPGSGHTTAAAYDKDVILWSQDVGKSEKGELASRMAVL
jgi:hypothetical protein